MKKQRFPAPSRIFRMCSALALIRCALHAADPSASAPAALTRENDLVLITLQPHAEQALRLKTVPIQNRTVPATRLFSGEVVTPLAAEGKTVAPVLGGTLEEVLRLADMQTAADGRILQARVQIDGARIAVERAQKMLSAEAGSVRNVDEAKTALALAEAALTTARAQRELLGAPVGQGGSKRAWVRVAIYSAEAPLLDTKAPAGVRMLRAASPEQTAQPVAGPPTANAQAGTLDWYYELPADTPLRAGERVAVEIPAAESKREVPVIPFSAVLHDIHGGQWVYAKIAEHTYARRRIQVARVAGTDAVLASGPDAETSVVSEGAAELFGTEFVTGK